MGALVSAIITTYKRPSQIVRRAIRSAFEQSYPDMEIIVVDDNREDAEGIQFSREVAKINEEYPFLLLKTADGKHGGQAARNTGINAAKGEYIALLDDDDEWFSSKIEKQVVVLNDNPQAGMCFCRGIRVNENFNPPYMNDFHGKGYKNVVRRNDLLKSDCIGTTSQAMVRKCVFEDVGCFDEKFPARQDYEMWIRITGKYDAIGVDEQLFRYYITKGEKSVARSRENCVKGYELIYEKYYEDIKGNKEAIFNIQFHIGHHMFLCGDKFGGILKYIKAFFISPVLFWNKGVIKLGQIGEKKIAKRNENARNN